ncbi:Long-chain-fatty-acid-coa ligase, partial [Globisporangium splendens]
MGAGQSNVPMSEIDFESYRGVRYAKEVPNTRNAHQGPIYMAGHVPDLVMAEQTCYHAFLKGHALGNGTRPCYGTRKMANGVAGEYEWVTYGQVKTRTDAIASGLAAATGLKRQDMVGIFSKNRMEWCLTSHATDRMAYVLVPLYDTLGPDAVPYIVNHTELTVMFAGVDQFNVVMECKDQCPKLQFLIQFEDVTDEQRRIASSKNIVLKSLSEIEQLGRSRPLPADPPTPDDISTICYTSGTTGNPKGVVLTQRNVAITAVLAGERLKVESSDVHISYLPLPHVFERAVITAVITNGAATGFYQGDVLYLMDDMATLKPTLFVSVPRLFNRVYDKIVQGVAAAGGLKKILFDQAFASKKAGLADGYKTHAFWDALVFSKIRLVLGGRVRIILSGSAPLAAEVKDFLKIVMCCDVVEGYGLSETAAALTLASAAMPLGPHVGPPILNAEVRLEDVPEMNYTSNDKPRPRGEVLFRGPNLFAGYYKEPEKTAEAVDKDGWFHTGDIGCWNADGTLSIIDRKKNIFKLSQGEYVAAEKVEGVYLKSKYVAQIFVYGDSLQSVLVAVVVPDPEVAEAWGQSKGLSKSDSTPAKLANNPEFQKEVLQDMDRTGKEAQLRGFEFVKKVHYHPDAFTMDQGLITPTFKLKRPQLKEFFQQQINDMYAQLK